MDKGSSVVCSGYCNVLPHSWWLKTTSISSSTVLQASLKSRISSVVLTLEALWKTCSLILSTSGVSWFSLPCGYISPTSALTICHLFCVCICVKTPPVSLLQEHVWLLIGLNQVSFATQSNIHRFWGLQSKIYLLGPTGVPLSISMSSFIKHLCL